MPTSAPKKRGSKPPIRRVPPGENRTARKQTLGCAVTKEEKFAVQGIAQVLGFKGTSQFIRYIVDNVKELSENPMHAMAWQAEVATRLAKASGIEVPADFQAVVTPEMMATMEARADAAAKSFGVVPEKREEAASAASTSTPEDSA